MLTNRSVETAGNPWEIGHTLQVLQAAFRRGILKAKVTVSDLTCWTARMESMERLRPGMTLWLTLPGIEAKYATVIWGDGFSAGLRFDAPLHPAVLDAILEGRIARLH